MIGEVVQLRAKSGGGGRAGASAGGSFGGLVTYLTDSQDKEERVGEVRVTNCVSRDPQDAILEVRNTQAMNTRAGNNTYHFLLSLTPGETPSAEVLHAIEDRACEALGFGEHQRVSVVHWDTDCLHIHVAVNRVHPTIFTAHSPSFDRPTLNEVSAAAERDFGLVPATCLREACGQELAAAQGWGELQRVAVANGLALEVQDRALVFVDEEGRVTRATFVMRDLELGQLEARWGRFDPTGIPASVSPPTQAAERPGPRARAPKMEALGDVESLIGWVKRECGKELTAAVGWAQLHEVATSRGLELKPRGAGLVFVATNGTSIMASKVARGLSKAALERRLGPFQPRARGAAPAVQRQYKRQPVSKGAGAPLYRRYLREQSDHRAARKGIKARLDAERVADFARLKRAGAQRRAVGRLMRKGVFASRLWAATTRLAQQRDAERLREKHRAAVRGAAGSKPLQGWVSWLKEQAAGGDVDALAALRSRDKAQAKSRNTIAGRLNAGPQILAGVAGVTASGATIYKVAGGSVRDDGKGLALLSAAGPEAFGELVRLAQGRYGNRLTVKGGPEFTEQVLRAAVEIGGGVAFADPKLEVRRQQLASREVRDGGRRGPAAGRSGRDASAVRGGQWRQPQQSSGAPTVDLARAIKSRAVHAGRHASGSDARVRSVSEGHVVGRERRAAVLQQGHARNGVGGGGPSADHSVRRSADRGRVTPGSGIETRRDDNGRGEGR